LGGGVGWVDLGEEVEGESGGEERRGGKGAGFCFLLNKYA